MRQTAPASKDNHGQRADSPQEILPRGWRDVAWRLFNEVQQDRVTLIAAGAMSGSSLLVTANALRAGRSASRESERPVTAVEPAP